MNELREDVITVDAKVVQAHGQLTYTNIAGWREL